MAHVWMDRRTRGRPRWTINYTGLDGKDHRERTDARSKEQALRLLAQRLSEITEARLAGVQKLEALKPMMFEQFVQSEYLPHCRATHTESTYRTDQGFARAVMKFFGAMVLRSITSGDVQRFVDQEAGRETVLGNPIRPATVNRELMFISGVMGEALRRGYVDRNSVTGISQLPERNQRLRFLSDQEEDRILELCPAFLRPIVLTALHTGMRHGELLNLKWADLDFERSIIRVTHTKNHKTRYVPMNAICRDVLEVIAPFTGPDGPSPFVFTNPETGTRYHDAGHAFGRVVVRASISEVTFHTLRHTFASRLAQAGIPLNTIRELLGHGSMVMTMRYAHLAPNNLREAVGILARSSAKSSPGTRQVQNAGSSVSAS